MTLRLSVLAAACALAVPAQASDPPTLSKAFGNTVLAIYPDGRAQQIWLHEDHTYDALGRRGAPSSGRWTLKDEMVCFRQSRPLPLPFKYCTSFPSNGDFGVTWEGRDFSGVPIRLTLQRGRPPTS
jgi:hypothetical protein